MLLIYLILHVPFLSEHCECKSTQNNWTGKIFLPNGGIFDCGLEHLDMPGVMGGGIES